MSASDRTARAEPGEGPVGKAGLKAERAGTALLQEGLFAGFFWLLKPLLTADRASGCAVRAPLTAPPCAEQPGSAVEHFPEQLHRDSTEPLEDQIPHVEVPLPQPSAQ